jgi:hypothetical protein
MARPVRPSHQEFLVLENEVIHKPTDASWSAYPAKQSHSFLDVQCSVASSPTGMIIESMRLSRWP